VCFLGLSLVVFLLTSLNLNAQDNSFKLGLGFNEVTKDYLIVIESDLRPNFTVINTINAFSQDSSTVLSIRLFSENKINYHTELTKHELQEIISIIEKLIVEFGNDSVISPTENDKLVKNGDLSYIIDYKSIDGFRMEINRFEGIDKWFLDVRLPNKDFLMYKNYLEFRERVIETNISHFKIIDSTILHKFLDALTKAESLMF